VRTLLAAAAAAVLLAGCGGDAPHLRRADAAPLLALAHRIPGESACAQARDIRALAATRTRLVNAGRVPAELLEPLSSAVNALLESAPPCVPAAPAAAPGSSGGTTPPGHGRGRGRGHDKHGGEGDD